MTTQERIDSKLNKIESKKAVILKKQGWIVKKVNLQNSATSDREKMFIGFDIEHLENDIKSLSIDIEHLQNEIDQLKVKREAELKKESFRNIPVLLEFIENWKKRSIEWYTIKISEFYIAREKFKKEQDCLYEKYIKNNDKQSYNQMRENKKNFNSNWSYLAFCVVDNTEELAIIKMKKELDKDAIAKYDDLVERAMKFTGVITDVSNLSVGVNGEINGIIIGEKGKCKILSISAGGYNIQCYHFRVLVNPL